MVLTVQGLDAVLPLALLMAHERNKGQGSFWQPYLGLLPSQPGCAWLMDTDELDQALKSARRLVGASCKLSILNRADLHRLTKQASLALLLCTARQPCQGCLRSYALGFAHPTKQSFGLLLTGQWHGAEALHELCSFSAIYCFPALSIHNSS